MTLALMAKAFTLNNTTSTNNNQRSSSNPRNCRLHNWVVQNAVQNPSIQIVENMNGFSVVLEIANQYRNRNVVTTPTEGNGNGINGIHSTQEEFEFMATADAYEETERVKASTSSKAAKCVRDFKSLAKEADESLAKHKALELEIERLLRAVNDWYKKCEEYKYDKISYDKAYNDMQQKIEWLQAQLGDQKGKSKDTPRVSNTLNSLSQKLENENVELEFQVLNYAKENAHLKTSYKNPFDSISVTRAQTKTITDSLQTKLYDTIYENAKLRAQLFDKVSEQKDTTHGTSTNTKFAKQSILGKPPSSSRPKLYAVTPLSKSRAIPKINESHALSKSVTSNLQCLITVNHDIYVLNYMNGMNSHGKKQKANVSNQKKHKAQVWKPKNVGSKESRDLPKPSTPRSCLRWSPTGRLSDLKGKIIGTSKSECQSDCFKCDDACSSNLQELISKRFPNSTFSMTGGQNWYDSHDVNDRVGKSIRSFVRRTIQMEEIKLFQSLSLLLLPMHPINVNKNKIQLHLLQL
nr:hypothetical protein [Tanacetum cinerariifolium]